MGKAIINTRAKKEANISDTQPGGIEHRSTVDHLLIVIPKETIKTQKKQKKPIYIAYLDVTQAYDKAWLDGIMHAIHNNGLEGPLWNIIKKFNIDLKLR
jgi:hypothetical protein